MAKVTCAPGRIIHVEDEGVTFTSLKEAEGEDSLLATKRSTGGSIVKMPKSYLGVLAQELLSLEISNVGEEFEKLYESTEAV